MNRMAMAKTVIGIKI